MKDVKIKTLFLGLILVIVSSLKAQDDKDYEYASVTYAYKNSLKQAVISVSIERNYSETVVSVKEGNVVVNLEPVIEAINKLSKDGWIVYNNSVVVSGAIGGNVVYYFLRRKK